MTGCSLIFNCRSSNDLRQKEAFRVMEIVDSEFPNDGWVDSHNKLLGGNDDVRLSINASKPTDFEQHGLTWSAKTQGKNPMVLVVATGGDEFSLNSFKVDLSRQLSAPTTDLFCEIIDTVKPYEAFYYFDSSERLLRQKVREFGTGRFPLNSLRCVHFLDNDIADEMGGVQSLMDLPNAKKTQIANGVLLDFTSNDGIIDANKALPMQLNAMAYFGLLEKQGC